MEGTSSEPLLADQAGEGQEQGPPSATSPRKFVYKGSGVQRRRTHNMNRNTTMIQPQNVTSKNNVTSGEGVRTVSGGNMCISCCLRRGVRWRVYYTIVGATEDEQLQGLQHIASFRDSLLGASAAITSLVVTNARWTMMLRR
jgi:hypothetical protein